jgi:putative selenium metabolism hydrolase
MHSVLLHAENETKTLNDLLRSLIAIPSETTHEQEIVNFTRQKMKEFGYDRILVDAFGNLIGQIGTGSRNIIVSAHVDTVGVGNLNSWTVDPFIGKQSKGFIYGRGACDQKAGLASALIAGKIIKEQNLLPKEYSFLVIATVLQEDDEGSSWHHLYTEEGIIPEVVLLTDATNCAIHRGHRGRMMIAIDIQGKSSHASTPELGTNAAYQGAKIITEIKALNDKLPSHSVLGKGSIAVTRAEGTSPSQNAVCDGFTILCDRRLTKGETKSSALDEIASLPSVKKANATIHVPKYQGKSFTGHTYTKEEYYPAWILPDDTGEIVKAQHVAKELFGKAPTLGIWSTCTDASAFVKQGELQVPVVGFGPGDEAFAHAPDEKVPEKDLVTAAAFYAGFVASYANYF